MTFAATARRDDFAWDRVARLLNHLLNLWRR